MKKFFSLLCAFSLVLSVSAGSFVPSAAVRKGTTKEALKSQLPADAALKMQRLAAPLSDARKAPAVAAADGVLAFDYVQCIYNEEMQVGTNEDGTPIVLKNLWEFQLYNGDDFVADVPVVGVDGKHIAGNYDLSTLGGVLVAAPGDTTDIVSGSFNIVYNTTANLYEFTLNATCKNTKTYTANYSCAEEEVKAIDYWVYLFWSYGLGELTFINLKDKPFVPTGDTIEVAVPGYTELLYFESDGDYYALYQGDKYVIELDWYPKDAENPSPLGHFTAAEEFMLEYCHINDLELEESWLPESSLDLEVTKTGDTIYLDLHLLAENGNVYHALLKNYTLVAKNTVNLEFTETEVSTDFLEDEGVVVFFGANEEYELNLEVFVADDVVGNYTEKDLSTLNSTWNSYLGDLSTMTLLRIIEADLVVAQDSDSYKLTGSLLCSNETQYNFEVKKLPLLITGDTIEIVTSGYTAVDWYDYSGDFAAAAIGEGDLALVVDWFPETPGDPVGVYNKLSDFDLEYCYVQNMETNEQIYAKLIELEVTKPADTLYVDVYMLCEDGIVYHALMKNYTITPKQVVNVEFTEMAVGTDYLESDGVVGFQGIGERYVVNFWVYVTDNTVVGEYTEGDLNGFNNPNGGSYLGDLSTMYVVPIVNCSLEITKSGDSYKLTGSLICEDEVQYNIVIDGATMAIGNVDSDAVKATKVLRDGQLVIERNGVEYNASGARIK